MTGGKKQALLTMLHPSIRFSGSSMEGNSAIRGESIVGEAIPWNGRCNNWNLMTIKKKASANLGVPPVRWAQALVCLTRRFCCELVRCITGSWDHEHSILAWLTVWPLGQKPDSGECAEVHIWGLPLPHGGESLMARGYHPDSDWQTQKTVN